MPAGKTLQVKKTHDIGEYSSVRTRTRLGKKMVLNIPNRDLRICVNPQKNMISLDSLDCADINFKAISMLVIFLAIFLQYRKLYLTFTRFFFFLMT